MDPFTLEFESIVNSFTDVEELMSFATFWDIHDLPVVRRRVFQLRNSGGNVDDFELALEFVRDQEEFMQVSCFTLSQSFYLLFFSLDFFLNLTQTSFV